MIVEEGLTRTWARSKLEIDHTYKVLQVTTSKSQCQSKIKYDNPPKVKRNEVARINIMQAQVEEKYFIFNLEYKNAALSKLISHGLPIKSQCST
jgi:hypothetical protein